MLSVHINLGVHPNYLHIHEYASVFLIHSEHLNAFCLTSWFLGKHPRSQDLYLMRRFWSSGVCRSRLGALSDAVVASGVSSGGALKTEPGSDRHQKLLSQSTRSFFSRTPILLTDVRLDTFDKIVSTLRLMNEKLKKNCKK